MRVLALFGTDWSRICFEAWILHLGIKEQLLKGGGGGRNSASQNKIVSHPEAGEGGRLAQSLSSPRTGFKNKSKGSFDNWPSRKGSP